MTGRPSHVTVLGTQVQIQCWFLPHGESHSAILDGSVTPKGQCAIEI